LRQNSLLNLYCRQLRQLRYCQDCLRRLWFQHYLLIQQSRLGLQRHLCLGFLRYQQCQDFLSFQDFPFRLRQ
jgi:hypothetical protein